MKGKDTTNGKNNKEQIKYRSLLNIPKKKITARSFYISLLSSVARC
jgi:hypothetical protein